MSLLCIQESTRCDVTWFPSALDTTLPPEMGGGCEEVRLYEGEIKKRESDVATAGEVWRKCSKLRSVFPVSLEPRKA